MTWRQVTENTLRIQGLSEAEIKERILAASLAIPGFQNTEVSFKPGANKKEFFEALKKCYEKISKMSPEQQTKVQEYINDKIKDLPKLN